MKIFYNKIKYIILFLMAWLTLHIVCLRFFGIHLFPRRAQHYVTLPSQLKDRGIFEDLGEDLQIPIPNWLPTEHMSLAKRGSLVALHFGDHVLALFDWSNRSLSAEDEALLNEVLGDRFPQAVSEMRRGKPRSRLWIDQDGDRIPDSLDIHLGILKVLRNRACYDDQVFPSGEVPRTIGVCTDVAVRAYRNAGIDLKMLQNQDLLRNPSAYGIQGQPKLNFAHRRVRRMFPFFKRHYRQLKTSPSLSEKSHQAWLPGDILFMSLLPGKTTADHVGLVSGHVQLSGYPLLAHNAMTGFCVGEHDILFFQKILGRFRPTLPR